MIFPAQETFLNLNVENSFFFQDRFMNRKLEQDLFDIEFFCNNEEVFNVTFDQFNACLLDKSNNFFKKKKN